MSWHYRVCMCGMCACACMCGACVHACTRVCACVYQPVWRPEVNSGVFLCCFQPCFLRQELRWASQQILGFSCLCHPPFQGYTYVPGNSDDVGPLHHRTARLRSKGHWGHPSLLPKHWEELFSGFQRRQQVWWDGSAGKCTRCWVWWPEFCPWDPHGGRR